MIIRVLESAFDKPVDDMVLIELFRLGRHRYKVRTRPSFRETGTQRIHHWLNAQGERVQAQVALVLRRGLEEADYRPPAGRREPLVIIENRAQPDWPDTFDRGPARMPPDEQTLRFLQQPLEALLEDDDNDWGFLRKTILRSWRRRFEQAIERGWLKPRNGGGITSFTKKVTNLINDNKRRLRTWALFDSDARDVDPTTGREIPSQQANDAEIACTDVVPFHRLRRRAIENYAPRAMLDYWASQCSNPIEMRERVRAFYSMSREQRHYFNMAGGFNADAKSGGVAALFDDVSRECRRELENGFASRNNRFKNIWGSDEFGVEERWLDNDDDGWCGEREQLFDSLIASM